MICPKCAYEKTCVIATIKSTTVQRWRKCPKCGTSFCTIEILKTDEELNRYAKEALKEKLDHPC